MTDIRLVGDVLAAAKSASSLHILLYLHAVCNQIGCTVHGLLCDRTDQMLVGVGSGCDARVNRTAPTTDRQGIQYAARQRRAAAFTLHPVERRRVEPLRPT